MRPTSLPEHLLEYYQIDNPRVFAHQRFPKVPPPPEAAFVMQRRVEKHDVDMLEIVNNAVYAEYAEEAAAWALAAVAWSPAHLAAQGLAAVNRRIHIQYQSPAVWGDRLKVVTYLLELGDSGGVRYVAVERASDGTRLIHAVASTHGVRQLAEGHGVPAQQSLATIRADS
jgi:YbgC/YbaW family acyl-CoA thioester hydrolase